MGPKKERPKPRAKTPPPKKPPPPKNKGPAGPSTWSRFTTWVRSFFYKEDRGAPIGGAWPRILNIVSNNFRGILGVIVPICVLPWQAKYLQHDLTVQIMWMWMFWFFLVQPIAIPSTGFIPLFLLPMTGVMSTKDTVGCYFSDNIMLFILSSMLLLLLNNSGFDRRMIMWFLCSGDSCQFSGKRLVFKASLAAFTLSMFSNRLIVTSHLTQYITPIYQNMQTLHGKDNENPKYDEMGYIINNAIQTSSAIGSIAIMHSAYASLAFRAIWGEAVKDKEYPDIFNYMQWSAFAFPLALAMWTFNVIYHMLLINCFTSKPMNAAALAEVKDALLKTKSSTVPKKISCHERLTVFFTVLALIIFFTRWSELMGTTQNGWADYRQAPKPEGGGGEELRMRADVTIRESAPVIKDAVVAAIFVVAMHMFPKGFNFLWIWMVDKRSELKELKPESGILWWRFVDQNTNYAYFFVIGAGVALHKAIEHSGLAVNVGAYIGTELTSKNWNTAMFVVCLLICILANVLSGVAALVVFLPLVLHAGLNTEEIPWPGKLYLPALGCGVGASLGFVFPFMYTPAYFCHHVGKVPVLRMLRYSLLSVIVCMLMLWFALVYWAPYCWDSVDLGIPAIGRATVRPTTTTEAAPE